MAGDTLRDAFRAELVIVLAVAPAITWDIVDTVNTIQNPDASEGYITLDFLGGREGQFTWGAPANNLHREEGQVTINVVTPLGQNRDLAESHAEAIRNRFRMRRFAAGSRSIRITATAPMGGGQNEAGGMWVESIGLAYEIFNVG